MRPQLNPEKLAKLTTGEQHLTERYGATDSPGRDEFDAKAQAWYYGEILKQARKQARITQQQLAELVGKKREYIALLERGETDMQLSTFLQISEALGLRFALVV